MNFPRSSGVLLHPTSLPGPHGVGDFGPEAYRFLDFLHSAGQRLWQVLPLNPTGYADSPFQCFSASAGNPLLISLERLVERGVLSKNDLDGAPAFPVDKVNYGAVIGFKIPRLQRAARCFFANVSSAERRCFEEFLQANATWLDDFALFMAVKAAHDLIAWTEWPSDIAVRQSEAVKHWSEKLARSIEAQKYLQFEFFRQWQELRDYGRDRGIRVIGDVPIYVAQDSVDVWSNRQFFLLDEGGRPLKIAGVPPDYFSATGQCWGNPIYNWPLLRQTGYAWWIERLRSALRLYDFIRIDHFRGFEAYWEVPAGETTAIHGRWTKGPGADLFSVLCQELGNLPIIAENLGVITPEVEAIRREFGFPGMAILQFAFGTDPQAPTFKPHNYVRDLVAYTGTHDNDTVVGWWTSGGTGDSTRTPEDVVREHAHARAYLGFKDDPIHWVMIRGILSSVANTAITPMQDLLGLGSEARMNLPGTPSGYWKWRMKPGAATREIAARLKEMVTLYDR
ncbi:MAG TPA: 4-alpha-glucanotransferase [Terriglobales bacterium]|nr:4-alpha-glucanotransferase [Terriglobales bacterium]